MVIDRLWRDNVLGGWIMYLIGMDWWVIYFFYKFLMLKGELWVVYLSFEICLIEMYELLW